MEAGKEIGLIYLDKTGNLCKGLVEKTSPIAYRASLFNYDNKLAGETTYYLKSDRMILRHLYCQQKYRGTGIGKTLIDIVESYVYEMDNIKAITGFYCPYQEHYDTVIFGLDHESLEINTRKFYERNHYMIIKYENYMNWNMKSNLENIRHEDFIYNLVRHNQIIYKPKQLIKVPRFEMFGDTIIDKHIFDEEK